MNVRQGFRLLPSLTLKHNSMKKIFLVAAATASMLSMNAETVTINHETSGALATELQAAIDADPDDALTAMSDITELIVTGEGQMIDADYTAIRALAATLVRLDVSAANLNKKIPGGQWDGENSGRLRSMTALEEVVLPDDITSIGGATFTGCKNLRKINLNDNIKVFPNHVFRGCTALELEALPANTTHIEQYAFYQCASLKLTALPSTIQQIRDDAFNESNVAFSELPASLTVLGPRAFRKTNVKFNTLPTGITTLNTSVFAASQCTFSTFPAHVTNIGTCVLQSVKTLPEFTIPNVAGLWTKIPDGLFYVNENIQRSFICRASSAPAVGKVTGSNWDETFGRPAMCTNTTMKVLASAMESYEATAPYNSMNLVPLTTPVQAPVIDIDGGDASKCIVYVTVAGKEHRDFSEEVYEGEGEFIVEVSSNSADNEAFYIERISYIEPDVYAEGDETQEPADENLLYASTGEVKDLVDQPVTVPVTVAPGMKQLHVKVANAYYILTGVEAVDAPANSIRRVGDTIYMTLPGAQLYDIAGRMVVNTSGNTVDLSMLPAGTYILRAGRETVKILK